MMICFPRDCKYCQYLNRYDMTVDDFTNICIVNGMQIDDCDNHFKIFPCPLDNNKKQLQPQ